MPILPKIRLRFVLLLFSVFLLSTLYSLALPSPTSAYITRGNPVTGGALGEYQSAIIPDDAYNKESFDATTFIDLLHITSTGIFGCVNSSVCSVVVEGGAVKMLADSMDWLYINQPASGVAYFADLGRKLGVSPAYAQGEGFAALSAPLLAPWRSIRNVAYSLFIILFVVFAFAIMFRFRLSPQVVITLQSALPRLIIALLLVTFSFAIVGLLIDLMKVITALAGATLAALSAGLSWNSFWANLALLLGSGALFAAGIGALAGIILGPIGAGAGAIIGLIGFSLILIIMGLLLLFVLFRVLFLLLTAYVGIILRTLFAPLIILFNALPGRPILFGWLVPLIAVESIQALLPLPNPHSQRSRNHGWLRADQLLPSVLSD